MYKIETERGDISIRKLSINELPLLTKLFDYNDVDAMIEQNKREIEAGIVDIFVITEDNRLIGELHAAYQSDDERAIVNQRAYLFAFRVHKDHWGHGYGKRLLQYVINVLEEQGCKEFTVGVEDDNDNARHIYENFGFTEFIARKYEEYQGDGYEYGLYLRRTEK